MSAKKDTKTQTWSSLPLPARAALVRLGRDIAVARRKRRISTADMASRLFVSRDTLWFAMLDGEWEAKKAHFERVLYSDESVSLSELNGTPP